MRHELVVTPAAERCSFKVPRIGTRPHPLHAEKIVEYYFVKKVVKIAKISTFRKLYKIGAIDDLINTNNTYSFTIRLRQFPLSRTASHPNKAPSTNSKCTRSHSRSHSHIYIYIFIYIYTNIYTQTNNSLYRCVLCCKDSAALI